MTLFAIQRTTRNSMKHTPRIAFIIAALAIVTPALAINTKPEPPKKEEPKEQPAPEPKSKPEPKSEPRAESKSSREPERENECPYTRTKANNWQCVATVRPRARPVTDQTIPAGELK